MEPVKTTLCYIRCRGCYLMLLRNKKRADVNAGKWVGVGGKFLPGETPEECLVREVREETGWTLTSWEFCGVIGFVNDVCAPEDMYLYVADMRGEEMGEGALDALPPLPTCNEGTFAWIPEADIEALNLWEGDRIFLRRMMAGERNLRLTLVYHGDTLLRVE